MPCASAAPASPSSSRGANCSADALYPSLSSATLSFLLHRGDRKPGGAGRSGSPPSDPPIAARRSRAQRVVAIGGPRLWGMAPVLKAVTETVHLAQGGAVNWMLVTDDSGVMLIDAGYPGDRDDVLASLRQLGYQAEDVRAILLTHAHIDHLGSAIWFAKTHSTPVYCHADEVGHAKREYLEQASPIDVAMRIWRPRWALWTAHLVRDVGLSREGTPTPQPLTAEVAAALPGQPMAIPTPGHTGGHCSYLVDGVLVSGDALVTGHPLLSHSGPQLLPEMFSHDQDGCIRSLAALALLDTEILLPGHGDLWRGPILEATKQATALAR